MEAANTDSFSKADGPGRRSEWRDKAAGLRFLFFN